MSERKSATMILMDPDEIPASLAKPIVKAVLEALPEAVRRSKYGEFVSEDDAVQLTGLTKRQLRYLREQRRITYYKPNRAVIYRTAELIQEIEKAKIPFRAPKRKRQST